MDRKDAIVITGASTGIGEATAIHLDRKGYRVFAGIRREVDGERLRSEGSPSVEPLLLDVIDPGSIQRARQIVEASLGEGRLAGLVNNAGISVSGPLEFLAIEDLREQLEVNLIGAVAVTQAFLPLLRSARGRIVNVGSISGKVASPFLGPYAMSKFALEAFSDSLRRELRPWGIQVSILEPGSIATPIWNKGIERASKAARRLPPRAQELYASSLDSVRRAATRMSESAIPPEEVAKVIERALTEEPPRTRYRVGRDAKLTAWLVRLLPDRVLDAIIARHLGTGRASRLDPAR